MKKVESVKLKPAFNLQSHGPLVWAMLIDTDYLVEVHTIVMVRNERSRITWVKIVYNVWFAFTLYFSLDLKFKYSPIHNFLLCSFKFKTMFSGFNLSFHNCYYISSTPLLFMLVSSHRADTVVWQFQPMHICNLMVRVFSFPTPCSRFESLCTYVGLNNRVA